MTSVEFFFDPSCPWTWVTSRWLATVAPHRDLDVTWRPWSLGIKNEGRELPDHLPAEVKEHIRAGMAFSRPALRVLQATSAAEGNDAVGRLYTEMGRRFHGGGDRSPDVIAEALEAADLSGDLGGAAVEEHWDEATRDNMAEVVEQLGDEVGVPIVAVRVDGRLHAMSGPIMTAVPPPERSLRLWDAVATIVTEPAVSELKRGRQGGPHPPDIDPAGRVALP